MIGNGVVIIPYQFKTAALLRSHCIPSDIQCVETTSWEYPPILLGFIEEYCSGTKALKKPLKWAHLACNEIVWAITLDFVLFSRQG